MSFNQPVNLLNEKELNQFLAKIVYFDEEVDFFETSDFRDISFVKNNKDKIAKAMVYQWIKTRMRNFLKEESPENKAFLIPLNPQSRQYPEWLNQYTIDGKEPEWLRLCFEQGKTVYVFNSSMMPIERADEIAFIRKFLYCEAQKKIEKAIATANDSTEGKSSKGGFRLRLDELKTDNKYKEYVQVLRMAKIWRNKLLTQSAKLTNVRHDAKGEEELIQFPDGMKIVRLLTTDALAHEGEEMRNCLAKGDCDYGLVNGLVQIYSLRDKNDKSHVTFMSLVNEQKMDQCKGKCNALPIKRYVPYCRYFVEKMNLDVCSELLALGIYKQNGEYYDLYNLPQNFVIEGNLDLSNLKLTKLPDLSHVIVKGNFDCHSNNLISLDGCPKEVGGTFDCSRNSIVSMEGAPERVAGDFICTRNKIKSLEGGPRYVGGNFICSINLLKNLMGAPAYVGGNFNCSANQLQSLTDCPIHVEGNFDCSHNRLQSLTDCPRRVAGHFDCSFNQLQSLAGCPTVISGNFSCSCNQLQSLMGGPVHVSGNFDCNHNNIINLEGAPEQIGGSFECNFCSNLSSIKGAPRELGGEFYCENETRLIRKPIYKNGKLQKQYLPIRINDACDIL